MVAKVHHYQHSTTVADCTIGDHSITNSQAPVSTTEALDAVLSGQDTAQFPTVQSLYTMCDNRIIMMLFGPPGAGKGTHGPKVVDKLGTPQLSTGDMLRDAVAKDTEVGRAAKKIMNEGGLVSDDIVMGIIKDRIAEPDCNRGFILDGFPRTVKQAEMLDELLAETNEKVSSVIELHVPDSILEERICGRWIHKASGRSYHVKFNPPKSLAGRTPAAETMKDNETGETLMQRPDDTAGALVKRLQAYHNETEPILDRYTKCAHKVNANQSMDKVWNDLEKVFTSHEDLKVQGPLFSDFMEWLGNSANNFCKGIQGIPMLFRKPESSRKKKPKSADEYCKAVLDAARKRGDLPEQLIGA
jgi:adenylate kinase